MSWIVIKSSGADKESNWLTSAAGVINLTMRLYGPKMQPLDGRWAPPVIRKLQ